MFVAATSQAFPVACVAELESLYEFSTDCGMVKKSLGLSEPGTHRRVCQKAEGACARVSEERADQSNLMEAVMYLSSI